MGRAVPERARPIAKSQSRASTADVSSTASTWVNKEIQAEG